MLISDLYEIKVKKVTLVGFTGAQCETNTGK